MCCEAGPERERQRLEPDHRPDRLGTGREPSSHPDRVMVDHVGARSVVTSCSRPRDDWRYDVSDQTIDRSTLPIRRPPFQGVLDQTLGGSQPDWAQIGHMTPPAGAPNVLVVLIDD